MSSYMKLRVRIPGRSVKVVGGAVDIAPPSDVGYSGWTISPPSSSSTLADPSARATYGAWLDDPDYTVHILDLPTELLEKIFLFSSYEQIGKVRRVCTRFNAIGSSLLNSAFQRLQTTMLQRFQQIKSQMPRRESARRNHPFARECDIVETVHMRLTLLQMSFGKHIERKHCCFFAGEILDEVYRIFRHIKSTPTLGRAYKVTDELFDLTTMAMEYFKEYIEPDLPEITYFATDFLDVNNFSSSGMKTYAWKNASPSGSTSNSASLGPIEEAPEIPPASLLINNKIKRLRIGMKKNNGQVLILKRELKSNKSQIADQQKQLIEYGTRLEENDKKLEEYSRKFSSLLQELNKCKTELQYWRSKSPANQPYCANCSNSFAVGGASNEEEEEEEEEDGGKGDSGCAKAVDATSAAVAAAAVAADAYEFVPIPLKVAEVPPPSNAPFPDEEDVVVPCHSARPSTGRAGATDHVDTATATAAAAASAVQPRSPSRRLKRKAESSGTVAVSATSSAEESVALKRSKRLDVAKRSKSSASSSSSMSSCSSPAAATTKTWSSK